MDPLTLTVVTLLAVVLGGLGITSIRKGLLRRRWRRQPLPDRWRQWLEQDFPRYHAIPASVRGILDQHLQVIVNEKNFEPCGGLDGVSERMKVVIGVQAALLLAGHKSGNGYYSKLRSILVYPQAFRDRNDRKFDVGPSQKETLLGESWSTGSVILSWSDTLMGARGMDDGVNVAIHEFAHQLDQYDGIADGVPLLRDRSAYRRWAQVFRRDYDDFVEAVETPSGDDYLLDPYGATDPAEFFAVASESFFETPGELREAYPELYRELAGYYQLDPAGW